MTAPHRYASHCAKGERPSARTVLAEGRFVTRFIASGEGPWTLQMEIGCSLKRVRHREYFLILVDRSHDVDPGRKRCFRRRRRSERLGAQRIVVRERRRSAT